MAVARTRARAPILTYFYSIHDRAVDIGDDITDDITDDNVIDIAHEPNNVDSCVT